MSTLVTFLHILVCLLLVGTVLLQQGKGGGMGGAFGGANTQTVFGSGGASGFLRRLTAIAATVFMLTSMVLAYIASNDAGDALKSFSAQQTALKKRKKEAEDRALQGDGEGTGAGTGEGTGAGTGDGTGASPGATEPTGAAVDDGDTGEDHAEGLVVPDVVAPADTTPAAEQPPLGADVVPGTPAPTSTEPKPAEPKPATP
jgi:preprotein translocase subunit SecG